MANKKKSKTAGSDKPSDKVRDMKPDQDPKGGASLPDKRPVKWELSEYDAVVNKTR